MLSREEFDRLVREVEEGIGRNHTALRRRTVLLAIIGYAGLLAWFLLVLAIAGVFFLTMLFNDDPVGKVVCGLAGAGVVGAGGWISLRVLLARLTPPKGRRLTRTDAPALFAVLDEIQARLHSAPFHEVLLTVEFNAGVIQAPRLGLFGWSRNCLLVGLPFLDALSPDEIRAVLAHEFAHLSREHGRLSHWLYRLRRSWEEYFSYLARPQVRGVISTRPLTMKFVDWFWPRFNAHAFVLSRANEYEADAQAAALVGAPACASALVRVQILSRLVNQRLWPGFWQLAQTQNDPPANLFLRLRDGLRTGATLDDGARWTDEAFQAVSTNSDTHPCLSERLRALGAPAMSVDPTVAASRSAAEALLGPALDGLRREVQQLWQQETSPQWREHHARAAAYTHRIAALERVNPPAEANVEVLWEKASALLNLGDDTAAEAVLREIVARRADHALANFQLGRLLLKAGKSEGEECLERAMATDEDLLPSACALLQEHHRQLGRADQIRAIAQRMDQHERDLSLSRVERSAVTVGDRFLPHALTPLELEALRRVLVSEPDLASAHLAQKELKYFKRQRFFVLCVRRFPAWHRLPNSTAERDIVSRLSQKVRLPGRVLVIAPSGSFGGIARKLKRPDNAVWP